MMKSVWKNFILFLLLIWAITLPAFAKEPQVAEDLPYDGYLFRLKENAGIQLFSMPREAELVCAEIGVYQTDSLEDIQELIAQDALLYVEPNYYLTLFEAPNDPQYREQWELQMIGAEAAWDWGLDGTGVRIGIIDSGYTAEHEDLAGANILAGYNYVDNNTDTSDDVGHGTFVTGIIAAQSDNDVGIAGIANGAEIVPLKAFTEKKSPVRAAVNAIIAAVDEYDCDILNMSWGMSLSNETLKAAIDYAAKAGVVLIAAVGNNGSEIVQYPAGYDNVIGVGAVDSEMTVASFSQKNASVDVVAPGAGYLGLQANGTYAKASGTSFACPTVTAMVALLLQYNPEMTEQAVAELLTASAIDLGEEGWDPSYGYGLVTVPEMLLELEKDESCRHNVVFDGAIEPTCTGTGMTKGSHCSVCNKVLVAQTTVDALGHDYGSNKIEPTCTSKGYTIHVCSRCQDTYSDAIVEALSHDYGDWVYETEETHSKTCKYNCGSIMIEDHGWDDGVVTAPTCVEAGYTTYQCSGCGGSYVSDTVAALGHNYEGMVTTEATCTADGVMTYICKNDATHTYPEVIPAWGHQDETEDNRCDRCNADLSPVFEAQVEEGKLILINVPDHLLMIIADYSNGQMKNLRILENVNEMVLDITGDTARVFFLDSQTYAPILEYLNVR